MIAKYDQMLNNRQHFVCVDPYVNSDNIILNNISCHFEGIQQILYLLLLCFAVYGRREQDILLFIISILSSDSLPAFTSHSKYCKNPGKICKNLCKMSSVRSPRSDKREDNKHTKTSCALHRGRAPGDGGDHFYHFYHF